MVAKSPDNVAKYRAGNEGVFKFFVGQVMRETRGQANPQAVNEIAEARARGVLIRSGEMENRTCSKKAKQLPSFSVTADDGSKVSLADYRGKNLVLYFYPKANTPGCTHEAVEFRDALKDFESAQHGRGRLQRRFRRGRRRNSRPSTN